MKLTAADLDLPHHTTRVSGAAVKDRARLAPRLGNHPAHEWMRAALLDTCRKL